MSRVRSILIATRSCFEWDLAHYVRDALVSDGIEVEVFLYGSFASGEQAGEALVEAAASARPDVVVGLKLETLPSEALARVRASGVPIALWNPDCFTDEVPAWIRPLLPHVDAFFTTAEGMVEAYRDACPAPVHWLVEGVHVPAFPEVGQTLPRYRSQVAFLGNVFQPPVDDESIALRRLRLLSAVGERFDLCVWGPQSPRFDRHPEALPFRTVRWPAYNEECVKICRAADIVLGVNAVDSVRRYFSNRTYLTLASGGFHLTSYVPGLETLFEDGKHLAWYRSEEECLEKIEFYLARPDERARIAQEGRELVRSRFTLAEQVRRLLGHLDRIDGLRDC